VSLLLLIFWFLLNLIELTLWGVAIWFVDRLLGHSLLFEIPVGLFIFWYFWRIFTARVG
jgi:hypothetical protein